MKKIHRVTAALAALAVLALTEGGCSSSGAAVPGVTATTITIGSHQILSGPNAAGNQEVAPAAKAYFDYVNANGGVNGRKIVYAYEDDAYAPTNTKTVVRKLIEQDKVFAIFDGQGTLTHEAVVGYINASKVPDLFPVSGCTCWNAPATLPYTFGWETDTYREGKVLGSYIEKNFPGKRVAYFYQNDDYGKSGVQGLDAVIPASQVVARQSYKPGSYSDVTPQMQAIARAGADVIVSFSVPSYTALLRLAQLKVGNTARMFVSYAGSDPGTLSRLLASTASRSQASGRGSPLIQGIVTDTFMTPITDTSNSWTALVRMIHERYLRNRPLDRYTEIGVATAYLFVQALQRAGKNPTRQSLLNALEQGGLSPGPGLTPLEYSQDSHAGYAGAQIGVIEGDAVVLRGQPQTTDSGRGPVVPYTAAQAPAPANGIPSH